MKYSHGSRLLWRFVPFELMTPVTVIHSRKNQCWTSSFIWFGVSEQYWAQLMSLFLFLYLYLSLSLSQTIYSVVQFLCCAASGRVSLCSNAGLGQVDNTKSTLHGRGSRIYRGSARRRKEGLRNKTGTTKKTKSDCLSNSLCLSILVIH